jgi:hypothetical protein
MTATKSASIHLMPPILFLAVIALLGLMAWWFQFDSGKHHLLEATRANLKDPSSAQFRNVVQNGDMICGEVNGKNGFGGYSGFERFVAWSNQYERKNEVYFESQRPSTLEAFWPLCSKANLSYDDILSADTKVVIDALEDSADALKRNAN